MAKYRTISEALKEIKQIDKNSSLNDYVLRKLAKTGKVSQIRSGTTTYIEMESLQKLLAGIDFEVKIITI